MPVIATALAALGRHGPVLLVISLMVGMAIPTLSAAAEIMVPGSAFLLTLGSFLSAALSPAERPDLKRLAPLAIAFVGLCIPALVYAILHATSFDDSSNAAIFVAALAPPVGSAAAIATMLGLRPRLALVVSIVLTLAAPLLMPLALAASGWQLAIDFGRVALRLVVIVGSAAAITALVVSFRPSSRTVLPDARSAAGLSVIGLVIVGLAVNHGVAPLVTDVPHFLSLLAMAAGTNVGLSLLGALAFSPAGLPDALTIGLLSGNRNVTLAWAVAGSSLPWDAQAYLAVCVVPVLALPLLLKLMLSVPLRRASSSPTTVGKQG